MDIDITQTISIIGAALILIGFAGNSFEWFTNKTYKYQILNLVGALLLTYTAFVELQYGFIILEATWAVVSLVAIIKIFRESKQVV